MIEYNIIYIILYTLYIYTPETLNDPCFDCFEP